MRQFVHPRQRVHDNSVFKTLFLQEALPYPRISCVAARFPCFDPLPLFSGDIKGVKLQPRGHLVQLILNFSINLGKKSQLVRPIRSQIDGIRPCNHGVEIIRGHGN